MALVHYFALPAVVGWIIAGVLGFLATLAVTFILYGMRHARVLTDHGDPAKSHSHVFHARTKSPANVSKSGKGHPGH